MKNFKTTVSILALAALTILNFTHAYKGYGASLQMILAAGLGSGDSGGSGGSGGTGDSSDCCSYWGKIWGNCNKVKQVIETDITCKTTTTTYFDIYGNVVGTVVIKFGVIDSSYGITTGISKVTEASYVIPKAKIVLCPTDGKCDNCAEYTPKCK